ncbi:MAG: hypothetical protein P8X90_34620, partial [Desulfobacterales bacterium]
SNKPLSEFFGKISPRTFVDVEFSVPCAVALKLHDVPHSQWHVRQRWQDPDISALAAKVTVQLDESYQKLYLQLGRASSRIPSRVEITLKNGKLLKAYCDLAWGSPQKPMNGMERLAKVRDLMAESLSPSAQEEIITSVNQLDRIDDVGRVMRLLPLKGP